MLSLLNDYLHTLEAEFIGDFTQNDLRYLRELEAFERDIHNRKQNEYYPAYMFRKKYLASTGIKLNREQAHEEFGKLEKG